MKSEKEQFLRIINVDFLSEEDKNWLLSYLNNNNLSDLSQLALDQFIIDLNNTERPFDSYDAKQLLNQIHASIPLKIKRKQILSGRLLSIAAILLISLSFGFYFFWANNSSFISNTVPEKIIDIKPGENKAVLTLGNGTQIALKNSGSNLLIYKDGLAINQTAAGQIKYQANQPVTTSHAKVEYNIISTPQAGQYQVVLSDGTKVWLNSNSSIRFPTRFTGSERKVQISGEAYFEVAEDKKMPFKVLSANQTVKVLGTHFNINAYADESAVKTTLIEGSLEVVKGKETVLLKPGQQAQTKSTIKIVDTSNLESEISWKSGMFYFEDSGIDAVMRQAARWYDLEIKYEGQIPVKHFNGKVPRNTKLSKFLDILEYSGVNFKIDGRIITIME